MKSAKFALIAACMLFSFASLPGCGPDNGSEIVESEERTQDIDKAKQESMNQSR